MKPIRMLVALTMLVVIAFSVNAQDEVSSASITIEGDQIIYTVYGKITDNADPPNPIEGQSVQAYCRDQADAVHTLGTDETNVNGNYVASYTSEDILCEQDDMAWVEFTRGGNKYKTSEMPFSITTNNEYVTIEVAGPSSISVPEFTTIGLGLAVTIVGAGLIYMRRH